VSSKNNIVCWNFTLVTFYWCSLFKNCGHLIQRHLELSSHCRYLLARTIDVWAQPEKILTAVMAIIKITVFLTATMLRSPTPSFLTCPRWLHLSMNNMSLHGEIIDSDHPSPIFAACHRCWGCLIHSWSTALGWELPFVSGMNASAESHSRIWALPRRLSPCQQERCRCHRDRSMAMGGLVAQVVESQCQGRLLESFEVYLGSDACLIWTSTRYR